MKVLILGLIIVITFIPTEGHSWCFHRDDGKKLCNGTRVPVTINSLKVGLVGNDVSFTPNAAERAFLKKLPPKEIPGRFDYYCNGMGSPDKLKCLKRGTHIVYNTGCKSKTRPNKYCRDLKGKGWVCREHWYDDKHRQSCFKKK